MAMVVTQRAKRLSGFAELTQEMETLCYVRSTHRHASATGDKKEHRSP